MRGASGRRLPLCRGDASPLTAISLREGGFGMVRSCPYMPYSQQNGAIQGLFSPADSSACSSALFQLELGLYSFVALARASVFLPRSF